jgi:hypothetical protein
MTMSLQLFFFFQEACYLFRSSGFMYVLHLFSLVSCGLYIYVHRLFVYKEEFSLNQVLILLSESCLSLE